MDRTVLFGKIERFFSVPTRTNTDTRCEDELIRGSLRKYVPSTKLERSAPEGEIPNSFAALDGGECAIAALPRELRLMLIERMDPATRARFANTCFLAHQEVAEVVASSGEAEFFTELNEAIKDPKQGKSAVNLAKSAVAISVNIQPGRHGLSIRAIEHSKAEWPGNARVESFADEISKKRLSLHLKSK